MAANTVSFYQILFAVARSIGKLNAGVITTYTDSTHMACANIQEASDSTFNGAIVHVMGGTTYSTVTAYTGSSKTFTLGTALVTAVGARLEWVFYDADMFSGVFNACNEMIRSSWGTWYRETVVDRSTATITLAVNTHSYSLPAACSQLVQIGIQPVSTSDIMWYDPLNIWRVEGQEGAFTLRFMPGYGGDDGYTVWTSDVHLGGFNAYGSFADVWNTQPLCLRYYEREPELTSETGTTQLPLDYASWVTAESYVSTYLANASQNTSRVMNVFLPQIQAKAAQAKARLTLTKPRRYQPFVLEIV